MKKFAKVLKTIGVAIAGGAVAGATTYMSSGGAITGRNVGVAAGAGALTAIGALVTKNPWSGGELPAPQPQNPLDGAK